MNRQSGYATAADMPLVVTGVRGLLRRAWRQLRRWQQLAAERRQLASLSDGALKDMNITRADVYQETQRPFWDDPLRC